MARAPQPSTMATNLIRQPVQQEFARPMDAAITMHVAATPADLDTFARALRGPHLRPGDESFAAASGL